MVLGWWLGEQTILRTARKQNPECKFTGYILCTTSFDDPKM